MKLFCDCIKDATSSSVHATTALGNSKKRPGSNDWKRRRVAQDTMADATLNASAKSPDLSLDEDDDNSSDIVHGSKSWSLPLDIKKYEPDQNLIFGWASVVEKDGRAIIDKQGDIIPVAELENAAYEFTLHSRDHGDMHAKRNMGKLVESMVFTVEKQKALGIDIGQVGWWVGFKVHDKELWAAHKRGERPEFSIGGAAIPVDVDENLFKRGARRVLRRFPFDQAAAGAAHHVLERLLSHQRNKLLREYSSNSLVKASDRITRIVGVLDEDDIVLENATRALVDHISRAAQRTGAKAVESIIGSTERLLKPEEQARLRAVHSSMADNVDYWTRQYGMKRAAELVGRIYDRQGNLKFKPDAEWNINATTNEVATKLVTMALDRNWKVTTLARRLEKTGLFNTTRASMIARTEISKAQNLAMLRAGYEFEEETGEKLLKVWLLGPDPCPICEENGGEEFSLDGVFESGDFAPPVHPNCMCEIQLIYA